MSCAVIEVHNGTGAGVFHVLGFFGGVVVGGGATLGCDHLGCSGVPCCACQHGSHDSVLVLRHFQQFCLWGAVEVSFQVPWGLQRAVLCVHYLVSYSPESGGGSRFIACDRL